MTTLRNSKKRKETKQNKTKWNERKKGNVDRYVVTINNINTLERLEDIEGETNEKPLFGICSLAFEGDTRLLRSIRN